MRKKVNMRKIRPYKTSRNALASLDNGGRFYNLLTQARDGNVTSAEVARVAGVFNDKQKMVLYLEMSLSALDERSVKSILSSLSDDLRSAYRRYSPQRLLPSEAQGKGKVAGSAIITGIPQFVQANSDFVGFVMIPISTGKSTTMMMIPMIDQYDVYELRDEETSKVFLIAHARGATKLPEQAIRCGGILKELKKGKKGTGKPKKFLEGQYYAVV